MVRPSGRRRYSWLTYHPAFARYIGIDYSGAQTPTASLKGLRVYLTEGDAPPVEVPPPPSPRKYWTRRGVAEWLVERIAESAPTLVGIDHGFSFPLRYFEVHTLAPEWPAFLDDFQHHWPTDDDHTYVDFVRDGAFGSGAARMGNARWRRVTEERAGGAKSVFHFNVQGSVAKSTHAGIPWLRFMRQRLGGRVHEAVDPARARERVLRALREGMVTTTDGHDIPVKATTVCVHSNTPDAVAIAAELSRTLTST